MLDGPDPEDKLHNPDPLRDRKNDKGGSILTSRGFMNLGCIALLVAGILTLLYVSSLCRRRCLVCADTDWACA